MLPSEDFFALVFVTLFCLVDLYVLKSYLRRKYFHVFEVHKHGFLCKAVARFVAQALISRSVLHCILAFKFLPRERALWMFEKTCGLSKRWFSCISAFYITALDCTLHNSNRSLELTKKAVIESEIVLDCWILNSKDSANFGNCLSPWIERQKLWSSKRAFVCL